MAYETKELCGAIFKNDRREERTQQPTHKGNCKIDGKEYWISAWVNESKAGNKYFSLKFQEKEDQSSESRPSADVTDDDYYEDIPF